MELANIIKEVQQVLFRNRYNVANEFGGGRLVYDMRVRDARFVPEPMSTSSNMKVLHYRWIVELLYQKLIV